jgi:hypothetical protein
VASGAVAVKLDGSNGFSASGSHFWGKSGARIVSAGPGPDGTGSAIAVWDAATGMRLWATPR